MNWLSVLVLVAIVRVHHSPLGGPAAAGTSSSWADGTEPVVSPKVHPNPDERLADLVDRKTGIAITAACADLGLTLTALTPIVGRLVADGRIISREGALHRVR
ncbi:MAG: hypothetical protein JWO90_435 [Solirubrobacterales bacterium]|nr:hypothetical protein [Solirubrobacterales bacterium]